MSTVSLNLPDALIARLDAVAALERRSRSNLATVALDAWLSRSGAAAMARDHLRRHAEMGGFPSTSDLENPRHE